MIEDARMIIVRAVAVGSAAAAADETMTITIGVAVVVLRLDVLMKIATTAGAGVKKIGDVHLEIGREIVTVAYPQALLVIETLVAEALVRTVVMAPNYHLVEDWNETWAEGVTDACLR
jgi:hypothetical protein